MTGGSRVTTDLYTLVFHFCGIMVLPMKTLAASPNIRISLRSKTVLQALAKREGKPMQAVLDEAIEHYQRDKFLDEVNAAYAALRNDAIAWKEEQAERALWDNAVADGLNDK